MKSLAIFVEGATELSFIHNLVLQIGGTRLTVEASGVSGGSHAPRIIERRFKPAPDHSGTTHYVLILDCGGEETVKTRIIAEHKNLTEKGFTEIIGIRDVRPTFTRDELPIMESALDSFIDKSLIPVTFVLSVMEIEAWFLTEWHHFEKIDPAITLPAIRSSLNFDPAADDMSLRESPADDLDNCYRIAGKQYKKKKHQSLTLTSLDMEHIYLELGNRIPYLSRLLTSIDRFLSIN